MHLFYGALLYLIALHTLLCTQCTHVLQLYINHPTPAHSQVTADSLRITDVDTPTVSALVIILHDPTIGDEYNFTTVSGLSRSQQMNDTARVITYSGQQDRAVYEDLLRSVQFFNNLNEPQPGLRRVSVQVFTPSDVIGGSLSSNVANINIQVHPLNDNAPQFSQDLYNDGVVENLPSGTSLDVVVSASDADIYGETMITYFIDGINPFVTIHPSTGVMTTLQPLDAEDGLIFAIVGATDNDNTPSPRTSLTLVTIQVLDENDQVPTFDRRDYIVTIPEDQPIGSVVLSVSANDTDLLPENSMISFQIQISEIPSSGSGLEPSITPIENLPFDINTATGNISLTSILDAELTTLYSFEVIAIDSGTPALTGTASVVINVENRNDNPPQFSAVNYTVSLPEDTPTFSMILLVSATDADIGNSGLVYSLLDTEHFSVNASSGVVSLILPLDFETQQRYNFIVIATDRGVPPLSSRADVVISVTGINDNSPQFTPGSYSFEVQENSEFEGQVFAQDGDGDAITFNLEDDAFEIDGSTIRNKEGVVLDFEGVKWYSLTVFATDGQLTSSANVTISILDQNDQLPVFAQDVLTVEILESTNIGFIVAIVNAVDNDTGTNAEIRYSITAGNNDGVFAIGASSGVISLERSLDFDTIPNTDQFTLTVMATNTAPPALSDTTTVQISIVDQNDLSPVLSIGVSNVAFVENSPPVLFASGIAVMDADSATHQLAQCEAVISNSPCIMDNCNEDISINVSLALSSSLLVLVGNDSIELSGGASEDVYMEVLSTLTYGNTDAEPIPGPRVVEIVCADEQFFSNTLNITITVELVNEFCPTLTASMTTLSYTEGEGELLLGLQAGLSLTDNDRYPHNTLEGLQITLGNRMDSNFETISVIASPSLTVTPSDAGSGDSSLFEGDDQTITLSGPATIQDFIAALQSLSYQNSQSEPTLGTRTISLLPMDATRSCIPLELTLTITPVNDNPPDITLTLSNAVSYLEGSGRLYFAEEAGLVISDPDHNNLFLMQAASAVLNGVLDNGMEVLEFNDSSFPGGVDVTTDGKFTHSIACSSFSITEYCLVRQVLALLSIL